MSINIIFGVAGAVLGFIGYSYYAYAALRGDIKPHVFSWFVWSITVSIIFFAQLSDGAGAGAWPMGISALLMCVITLIAFFKTRGEVTYITRTDWAFLCAALMGIPLWLVFDSPLISVFLLTGVDVLGYAPTFRKVKIAPHDEQKTSFALQGIKQALSIVALENYSLITALYPAVIVVVHAALVLQIYLCRKSKA